MVLHFEHIHGIDLVVSRWRFEISLFEEWEGLLTWNESDVSQSFMTVTVTYR